MRKLQNAVTWFNRKPPEVEGGFVVVDPIDKRKERRRIDYDRVKDIAEFQFECDGLCEITTTKRPKKLPLNIIGSGKELQNFLLAFTEQQKGY